METTVSFVDMFGDGTPPDKVQSPYGVQEGVPMRMAPSYEGLANPEAYWEQTMARLRDAGSPIPVGDSSVHGREEWRMRGRTLDGNRPPLLEVTAAMG